MHCCVCQGVCLHIPPAVYCEKHDPTKTSLSYGATLEWLKQRDNIDPAVLRFLHEAASLANEWEEHVPKTKGNVVLRCFMDNVLGALELMAKSR